MGCPCREQLNKAIDGDRALDGFTLMLFGGHFTIGKETLGKLCSYDKYIERVKVRVASPMFSNAHETVRLAFEKAAGGFW